ncbi:MULTISPECIES: FAD-dependent oxidoreductase [unclassified Pseudodesulfovibrio]|uniref:FAD-dependent oxidoreductase n=1 Tax=unclassified Pseudodesulfovibrio TaxID=2661612 RepID=UPI000FEB8778|nr:MULTISPECIES: FAD-dependent oxidoreductase [unclassified Pseudodesulfovibrio]MCJ2164758.1 FAD-dependent oxidoreductase [Pseudodesulfovibrio sp. S3-i]RWU04055.1 4Fe-4S dicluster domain-containing protein [Pseudodesulfovibrio sp. S3]
MIVTSGLTLFSIGLGAAAILGIASKLLYVKEDPRISLIEDNLPGANCGGCGYPGCSGAAAAIVAGKASASVCIVADAETSKLVAGIMGQEVVEREPELAIRDCTGGTRAAEAYHYEGVLDCRIAHQLYGGSKTCPEGCLGLGSCVRACPFNAIQMGQDGLPVIDPQECKACGNCVDACPRGVIAVSGMSARLLHLNQTTDCLAPCRQKCPAQINIPRYIEQIKAGDYDGALMTIRERNPLPVTCGRVCPRPCETECRRQYVDETVGINMLKRFVADRELHSGQRLVIPCAQDSGKKVAIIGGGPAGLSCAYFLRRLGHHPTIFEAMPHLGGQTRYGIPEYRLPKADLDWEIQGILDLGVETRMNTRFGVDFTIETLKADGYETIFLGIGAWQASGMYAEGEDLDGVMGGIEFLTAHALGQKPETGKRVIVVGGGNTAIDAARTGVRLGAEVTLMYRRTRAEMPADMEEIVGAEEEGVQFKFLAAPARVIGDENGHATHLEYYEMELGEPDASGRRSPIKKEGSEQRMAADLIIPAIGQKPDLSCLYEDGEEGACPLETTRWQTIVADEKTFETAIPGVFTAGDVYTGPDLVISAIGDGRKAARSMHYFMTQGTIPVPETTQKGMIPYTLFKEIDVAERKKRAVLPHLCHGDERNCTFNEVEGTLSESDAMAEADRCLRCGLICYDSDSALEARHFDGAIHK